MAQKKLHITGHVATEMRTYFGGEVALVPQEVPAKLAAEWVEDGYAEWVNDEADGSETEHVDATDSAKELAAAHGIDLASVKGSGADGRIVKADVEAAIAAASSEPEVRAYRTRAQD